MSIKEEKKQHMKIGERKTYINIKKEISTMYVYKWSQDLIYKSNVSKKKEKKRYILSSLHPSKCVDTPPNKMVLY